MFKLFSKKDAAKNVVDYQETIKDLIKKEIKNISKEIESKSASGYTKIELKNVDPRIYKEIQSIFQEEGYFTIDDRDMIVISW